MSKLPSRSVPVSPGATHPIPIGQIVAVLGFDASGRPTFEGRANLIARAPGCHRYLVNFSNEPPTAVFERFVHPEYQAAPEAYLAWMIEFWAACRAPAIADFFPAEISA